MNTTKSLVGTLAALAAGVCMYGQSSDASVASAGLLGQRHAAAGIIVEDFRDLPLDSGLGAQLGVNLPLAAGLDAAFTYEYVNVDDVVDLDGHALGATLRGYTAWSGVKPFADATLGYAWVDFDGPAGFGGDEDEAFWSLGVGVEAPVAAATALVGRVAYTDLFESDSDGTWSISAGVNHWFTPKLAGKVEITFEEDDAVVYGVGVAVRF